MSDIMSIVLFIALAVGIFYIDRWVRRGIFKAKDKMEETYINRKAKNQEQAQATNKREKL